MVFAGMFIAQNTETSWKLVVSIPLNGTIPNPWTTANLNGSELSTNTSLSTLSTTDYGEDLELKIELVYSSADNLIRYYKGWDLTTVFNINRGRYIYAHNSPINIDTVYAKKNESDDWTSYNINNDYPILRANNTYWNWSFNTGKLFNQGDTWTNDANKHYPNSVGLHGPGNNGPVGDGFICHGPNNELTDAYIYHGDGSTYSKWDNNKNYTHNFTSIDLYVKI
jgi:hypothetical protein